MDKAIDFSGKCPSRVINAEGAAAGSSPEPMPHEELTSQLRHH
jgi:hypothetical protein